MVQLTRALLYLAATCYAAVTGSVWATTGDGNATTAVVLPETFANSATPRFPLGVHECKITFTYWEHDESATFDINFVHSQGVDSTTERFHDDTIPIQTSNTENFGGLLKLVQIYPRQDMVCISAINLYCGWYPHQYGTYPETRSVTITADAIQESWIRKTGGQRKPVNWVQGPCMYFRNAGWDKGAFRALDVYRGVFECGNDYMCIAGRIETFSH